MNTDKLYLVLPVLMLVAATGTPTAFAVGINKKTAAAFPSELYPPNPAAAKITLSLACINVANGEFLDCPFTVKIPKGSNCEVSTVCQPPNISDDNGGHTHTGTNNSSDRPLGKLEYNGSKGVQQVSGNTGNDWAVVTHHMPEFSGKIVTSTLLKVPESPPGYWRCLDGSGGWECTDTLYNSWTTKTTVDVRVPGLESLPGSTGGVAILYEDGTTAPYIKKRNADTNHLDADAYYAVPTTNVALAEMARIYKDITDKPLSINDMSLPKGGKFDVDGSWSGSHAEHRLGISADINPAGTACQVDKSLLKAVDTVIPAVAPRYVSRTALSRLLCESGGRKHIDFDGIPVIAR